MNKLWQNSSNIGIYTDLKSYDIIRARLINQISICLGIMMFFFLVIYIFIYGSNFNIITYTLLALAYVVPLYLHYRRHYNSAKHYFILNHIGIQLMFAFLLGSNSNIEFALATMPISAIIMFRANYIHIIYLLLTLVSLVVTGGMYHYLSPVYEIDQPLIYNFFFASCLGVIFFLYIRFFKMEMLQSEKLIKIQNDNLLAHQFKIDQQNKTLQDAYNHLEKNRGELHTITESVPLCIVFLSEDYRYLFANSNYEKWTGRSRDTVINKTFAEIHGEKSFYHYKARIDRAIAGEVISFERKTNNNFQQKWFNYTLLPAQHARANKKGFYCFIEDTTKVKEKEQALLKSNEQLIGEVEERKRLEQAQSYALSLLETTLESTAYGILVVNEKGETERFNQHFIKMWNISPAVAASDDKALNEAILSQLQEPDLFISKIMEIQDVPHVRTHDLLYFRDGRVVERHSCPHYYKNKIIGRVWTFLDVTIQKNIESKLVAANEELQQFASVASHDMKEPLRTISSFSTLLSRRIPDQPAAQEYLGFIKDAAGRMTNLLEDLINYARADRSQETAKEISLDNILFMVQNNLHTTIHQKNVILEAEPLPKVLGQSTPFVQLFQNLIANAIKFQEADNQPLVKVKVNEMGSFWRISIEDNGIGMAKEYQEKIFQPFTRLHSMAEFKGSGIGLATCTKIVQHHGGRIWVDSELGEGTTFHFTLPKIKEDKIENSARVEANVLDEVVSK